MCLAVVLRTAHVQKLMYTSKDLTKNKTIRECLSVNMSEDLQTYGNQEVCGLGYRGRSMEMLQGRKKTLHQELWFSPRSCNAHSSSMFSPFLRGEERKNRSKIRKAICEFGRERHVHNAPKEYLTPVIATK